MTEAYDHDIVKLLAKLTFSTIVFCSTLGIGPYLFYIEKFTTEFKLTEKKWHVTVVVFEKMTIYLCTVKKKSPFSNARALITGKIMRSRDAQCNAGEWP